MDSSQNKEIENATFELVFGSPEPFLGRWRTIMLTENYQERLGLIVVDEAHTVIHWCLIILPKLTK